MSNDTNVLCHWDAPSFVRIILFVLEQQNFKGGGLLKQCQFLLSVNMMFVCTYSTWFVNPSLVYVFHFRWKGENVSTNEVANILTSMNFIHDANVYGVTVPGKHQLF